jgi:hypothetical protein
VTRNELRDLIGERMGIGMDAVVSEYGMAELSSQAYDHAVGESGAKGLLFPHWARAQVLSPETGVEVGENETGLVRVLDLANVFSILAIQTQDLATRKGDRFVVRGRALHAEPRGCSLMFELNPREAGLRT